MRYLLGALALLLLGDGVARGQGGAPLSTDDPGTPGAGHWEVNLGGTLVTGAGGTMIQAPIVDVNLGVGERLQVTMAPSWGLTEDEDTESGPGPILVAAKWRFVDQEEAGLALAVALQLHIHLGDASAGGRLGLLVGRGLGPVGVGLEVGYLANLDDADVLDVGLVAGIDLGVVAPCLEVHGHLHLGSGALAALTSLGVRVSLGEHVVGLASAGVARGEGPTDALGYLALRLLF
jgi:hypothetical protein